MSFSKDIKQEILSNKFKGKMQALAFLCGLCYSSASFDLGKTVQNFKITTDFETLADDVKGLIINLYGNDAGMQVGLVPAFKIGRTPYFYITISNEVATRLLEDIFAIEVLGGKYEKNNQINDKLLATEESLKAFVSGVFIGSGTSSIKLDSTRKTTGYHLEISNASYELLHEISVALAQFDILAKLTKRKNMYVLYIKDAEEVSNMLALMGASNAVLTLQNEIITRQMRNKVNRQNNCYVSNFSKTLNASYNQLEAIRLIDETYGISSLSPDLQEVALLRLANTEESLEELLKLTKTPLTKSALNHRFQKLIKMANKIKGI
ncbi:MAG: DNA-binding protein WhiA [Clostridia bacterium]|nr:DNA-binding protein WhiA [Clostridia bacterium]